MAIARRSAARGGGWLGGDLQEKEGAGPLWARLGPQGRDSREPLVAAGRSGCTLPADPKLALPGQGSPLCPLPARPLRAEFCERGHHQVFLLLPSLVKAVDACRWGHIPYLGGPHCPTGQNSVPSSKLSLGADFQSAGLPFSPLEPTVWKGHM